MATGLQQLLWPPQLKDWSTNSLEYTAQLAKSQRRNW